MQSSRCRHCASLAIVALTIGCLGCGREPLGTPTAIAVRGSVHTNSPQASGRIKLVALSEPPGHRFEVTGLGQRKRKTFAQLDPERQAEVLDVQVVADLTLNDPPKMLGTFSVEGDAVCFTPRFPLEPGVRYRVFFDGRRLPGNSDKSTEREGAIFEIERESSTSTTKVEQIYPTSDQLPENQLKFYIHFSAPMGRGEAYRRVHLVDAAGKEVEAVFLELGEELWDRNLQRFTLYFDPGRVKRGLKPREELGPVLVEGRRYALVVDGDWRDAARQPLASGARKEFSVGPPDDRPIDPASWKLESPKAGSSDPLLVRFGEPLDHAQLERVIWVAAESGEKVAGSIRTSDNQSSWQFTPDRPWTAGNYRLVAETTLEDLAGNSIGRPFEVDEFGPVQKRVETETVSIPFEVK
jgi:hypothetical protein